MKQINAGDRRQFIIFLTGGSSTVINRIKRSVIKKDISRRIIFIRKTSKSLSIDEQIIRKINDDDDDDDINDCNFRY